jgi:hypothetical protein
MLTGCVRCDLDRNSAFGVRKYSALKLPDVFGVALDADWTVVLERLQNRAVER